MKNLVVGAGLTGAVIAERLASKLGESVTVIEKESHLGGIYYDYFDGETGNLVHANHYNVLHTNIKYVWDYLNQFGEMKPFYFSLKPNNYWPVYSFISVAIDLESSLIPGPIVVDKYADLI